MEWAKRARDAYLAIGEEYEWTRRRPLPVADFADFGWRALDVGSGRGAQPKYLEHEHRFVVHCDLDRRLTPGGDSVECEATMLPFRDRAFDVAYLVAVIHHMPPEAVAMALKEAVRAARRVVVTTWMPSRGRQIGPGLWEVPWGSRAVRLYYHYTAYDIIRVAPLNPLAMGLLRRRGEINYFVLL